MTRNGKMQKVMMRLLGVMLVASFVLAVMSFIQPKLAFAEHYCYWEYWYDASTCGNPCGVPAGTRLFCNYWWEREKCCDAYQCWHTGQARKMFGGCWCANC
jgi:L-asparagine transporter-like permease